MASETQSEAPQATTQPEHAKSEFELGHDDPTPGPLAAAGVIGALIVLLVILGTMGFYLYFEQMEIEQKVYMAPHPNYEAYLEEKRAVLEDPAEQSAHIADPEEREALERRLPIDEALRLAGASVAPSESAQTQPGE